MYAYLAFVMLSQDLSILYLTDCIAPSRLALHPIYTLPFISPFFAHHVRRISSKCPAGLSS